MSPSQVVACVFGGLFLTNTIPHLVSGLMGRPFQSPFARPRGEGLSSSTVNIVWAFFNLLMAWLLLVRVVEFDLRNITHVSIAGIPSFLGSLLMARRFGRFNGGNNPGSSR